MLGYRLMWIHTMTLHQVAVEIQNASKWLTCRQNWCLDQGHQYFLVVVDYGLCFPSSQSCICSNYAWKCLETSTMCKTVYCIWTTACCFPCHDKNMYVYTHTCGILNHSVHVKRYLYICIQVKGYSWKDTALLAVQGNETWNMERDPTGF